ncbi:MBL fold metallo-hydrolase [Streptomyces bobili]|uniref:MBL fold metallo-hydrolase n=1 Tax=Streptomyces bobili TaxID=67280 RepID=UPI003814EC72
MIATPRVKSRLCPPVALRWRRTSACTLTRASELVRYWPAGAAPDGSYRASATGQDVLDWSPTSSILISNGGEALLVDPLFTTAQSEGLLRWLSERDAPVTSVYVTHGHGDHWFGLGAVLQQYPGARLRAARGRRGHGLPVLARGPQGGLARMVPRSAP